MIESSSEHESGISQGNGEFIRYSYSESVPVQYKIGEKFHMIWYNTCFEVLYQRKNEVKVVKKKINVFMMFLFTFSQNLCEMSTPQSSYL